MKCLKRNMTKFEYLPYDNAGSDLNEDGEHTGDYSNVAYRTPVPYEGNISAPSGNTTQTFYGEDIRYTHTLVMDNPNAAIDEYGLIRWNGELYDIQSVKRSINTLNVALLKQTVDHAEGENA